MASTVMLSYNFSFFRYPISTKASNRIKLSFSTSGRLIREASSPRGHPSRFSRNILSFSDPDIGTLTPKLFSRWLKCFNRCSRLVFGIVGLFFLCLDFFAEAYDNPAVPSFRYPCEDVTSYYANVGPKGGAELMKELYSIVSGHRSLSYKEVWDALKILDAVDIDSPETSSDIVEIYSLRAVSKKLSGRPEGWNREHLWPRSYGLADGSSLTDLHNIRPADVNVNSARGNKYYGECASYSRDCWKPANHEAAPDTETDKERWAPPLEVRGDIARSLMYMAVRYGLYQPVGSTHLQLSNSPSIAMQLL